MNFVEKQLWCYNSLNCHSGVERDTMHLVSFCPKVKRSYLRWTWLYYIFPLSQAGFLNDYVGVDIAEWMLLCADDALVQSNGVDCDIFVMKHIEAIYKGEEPFFDAVWALYPLLLGIPVIY